MPDERTLSTPEVLRLTGMPYTTLDYWVRQELIVPSAQKSERGRRRPRRWTFHDVVELRVLLELHGAGCSTQLLKKARKQLESWNKNLSAHLLYIGDDVAIKDDWDNVISVIREPGQSVLKVVSLPLGAITDQVTAGLIKIDKERARQQREQVASIATAKEQRRSTA